MFVVKSERQTQKLFKEIVKAIIGSQLNYTNLSVDPMKTVLVIKAGTLK